MVPTGAQADLAAFASARPGLGRSDAIDAIDESPAQLSLRSSTGSGSSDGLTLVDERRRGLPLPELVSGAPDAPLPLMPFTMSRICCTETACTAQAGQVHILIMVELLCFYTL